MDIVTGSAMIAHGGQHARATRTISIPEPDKLRASLMKEMFFSRATQSSLL